MSALPFTSAEDETAFRTLQRDTCDVYEALARVLRSDTTGKPCVSVLAALHLIAMQTAKAVVAQGGDPYDAKKAAHTLAASLLETLNKTGDA